MLACRGLPWARFARVIELAELREGELLLLSLSPLLSLSLSLSLSPPSVGGIGLVHIDSCLQLRACMPASTLCLDMTLEESMTNRLKLQTAAA